MSHTVGREIPSFLHHSSAAETSMFSASPWPVWHQNTWKWTQTWLLTQCNMNKACDFWFTQEKLRAHLCQQSACITCPHVLVWAPITRSVGMNSGSYVSGFSTTLPWDLDNTVDLEMWKMVSMHQSAGQCVAGSPCWWRYLCLHGGADHWLPDCWQQWLANV